MNDIRLLPLSVLFASLGLFGQETTSPDPAEAIDPVETAYQQLLELDDAALKKIDEWIRASQRPDAKEADTIALAGKIQAEIAPVHEAYKLFIKTHPTHARAHLTYASFLTDIGKEDESLSLLIKATELDPNLPAAWNNLANYYGHFGEVKKAFGHYERAIEIAPKESVYYHNFGTTVFLFRKDVREHYQITEEEVFDKALKLYEKALALDPKNFDLAEDIAQTYYGIRTQDVPSRMARPAAALKAWRYAETLAPSDFEKQGVFVHKARALIELMQFNDARQQLEQVNLPIYRELRDRVGRRVPGYQATSPPEPTPTDPLRAQPPSSPPLP